jgi:hypothetical protein
MSFQGRQFPTAPLNAARVDAKLDPHLIADRTARAARRAFAENHA